MAEGPPLAQRLRQALAAAADPAQAPAMQGYMKSEMPFLGIAAPLRRRIVAEVMADPAASSAVRDAAALQALVAALWRGAKYREERYAALDLLRLARLKPLLDLSLLPLLHEMLLTGPWWDHNDEISGLALGLLLQRHPAEMKSVLRNWARSDSLWLRRAALLSQRNVKQGFDAVLLYDCILPSLLPAPLSAEFFIRKGMGWALRERSRAAPVEVRAFVAEYGERLSALTRREALRNLS